MTTASRMIDRLAAVALFAATLAAFDPAAAQQAAPVGLDPVVVEPLSQTTPVIGRFVARQAGVVAARTAGPIDEMAVQIGDRVAAGDVLARLDIDRLTWQRDLARATAAEVQALMDAATARVEKRRQELARLEGMRASAAFNQARYEDAIQDELEGRAALAAARAVLARAQANLRLAEDDLKHGTIRAPYDGVVSLRHTEIGAYVTVGAAVVSLINDGDLEIEADVPFNRVPGLSPGTVVTITLADGTGDNAIVRAIGAEENPVSRTRLVRFTPAMDSDTQTDIAHGAGESVDVYLPLGLPREVITVHKDAILKRQGLSLVYVVGEDMVARIRPVELGEAVGPRFVVLDGLAPGEIVVVRGNERIRPGQTVQPAGEG